MKSILCVIVLVLYLQKSESEDDKNSTILFTATEHVASIYGYYSEKHSVITEDGYILVIHRMFSPKIKTVNKKTVFLQHGLLDNSNHWVYDNNTSLAFLLADKGYDVWMGNSRGNVYSNRHVKYSENDPRYWNFSFHEMGYYDLPTTINYILNVKKDKDDLLLICHSQGCSSFFIYSSMFPEESVKNVRVAFCFGPAVFLNNTATYFKTLAKFVIENELLFNSQSVLDFDIFKTGKLLAQYCDESIFLNNLCRTSIQLVTGYDGLEMSEKLLSKILTYIDTKFSVKDGIHFAQLVLSGNFQMFDYGNDGNVRNYGGEKPPPYDLNKVKVPTYLYYGFQDSIITTKDVQRLGRSLPNNKFIKGLKNFNHVDFFDSKYVKQKLYDKLLFEMKKYS